MSVQNILNVFELATPEEVKAGIVWYAEAQKCAKLVSREYSVPLHIVVGVIAALSPNNKWERNVVNAEELIVAFLNGEDMDSVKVSTYHTMKRKAWSILEAMPRTRDGVIEILNGQKIVAFFRCIMGDRRACCVDGHARNIYYAERLGLTDNGTNIGKKEYAVLADAYFAAAETLSVGDRTYHAYEVQAITWVAWRRVHGIK